MSEGGLVTERETIGQKASAFFEDLWKGGDEHWNFESSEFEQAKYARQFELINYRRYENALEIGCGSGCFTRLLSDIADHVVAIDIAPSAIARARSLTSGKETVEYRIANIMECDLSSERPWDIVVMSETIYYLGWLYSFFDVGWLASELYIATREGGRLLITNTCGGLNDYLLRPWLIRTYRDLFVNVGCQIEREEIFRGIKNGVELDVLISVFGKGHDGQ